ncbi:hypothetical protein DYB36_005348 [Aphanomyces astaci]|uniref:BZIP domain-containing protein n=1 Tax=Aphanomyces astaci TaxID=112090 RepID=A0A397AML1_APHAT|nr:hypothetical protein DYB36_005348 [Aphanomyces astaci]
MLRTTGGAPELSSSLIRRRQKDKEMKRKKREMYAQEVSFLRNQVKALRLNVRTARMLLPWREVAEALYDDTAAATVTNTNLRSVLRRLQIFHGHVQHLVQTSQPFSVAPALQLESWKDTHLFRGDDMRRSGFEYISQLALHTMPSVLLAPAATPVPSDPSYIQAQIKHGVVYVDVLHACTVPHATLDDVVGVAWAGLNDFVRQAIGTDDCVKPLDRNDDEISYVALKGTKDVTYNSLHRLFRLHPVGDHHSQPHDSLKHSLNPPRDVVPRAVIVARSILADEVHPYPTDMLMCDSVEW